MDQSRNSKIRAGVSLCHLLVDAQRPSRLLSLCAAFLLRVYLDLLHDVRHGILPTLQVLWLPMLVFLYELIRACCCIISITVLFFLKLF